MLSRDQASAPALAFPQTFEMVDTRPYFRVQAYVADRGDSYVAEPQAMRSGPDENGNYHFTFRIEYAPPGRLIGFSVGTTTEEGICYREDSAQCELAKFYGRSQGSTEGKYRDFSLKAEQIKQQVTSSYSFIAGGPAMVLHEIRVFARKQGRKRRLVRRTRFAPRAAVFTPATSNVQQTVTRSLNVCLRPVGVIRHVRGTVYTFDSRAWLVVDGRKVGVRKTRAERFRPCRKSRSTRAAARLG